ncbi:uncharacterized protein LOC128867208 isoform X2 [Anastrepha ludens]|uniref:uncharacterized protein LOC128867208 isoform X2 n=1 Tax=Anastrepha ludens TaxID=28586 RepID=UPI0023B150F4|nr:uncharacterized protein LOC128867208 isoform X2 [Anastrepha ludens]
MIKLGAEHTKTLDNIFQAANKHPNSRVSKLIHTVEAERSQKNIVLLLMELAEHAEYATDFGISLKYYLDLFEQLGIGREIVLNEAGLLLLNSSKIYSRRVDFVQDLVERQILTLNNADKEIEEDNAKNQTKDPTEKPKRTRKRLVAAVEDPYEVELIPRKFRKLTEEKRFMRGYPQDNPKVMSSKFYRIESEQYIHPAAWTHASIVDLENEEDIDSKRNYKLFTYHVEHRYNTLVADINFRLHFKVKDYIDEEEERLAEIEERNNSSVSDFTEWPPLSEEYVEKYLDLENRALAIGEALKNRKRAGPAENYKGVTRLPRESSFESKHNSTKCVNETNTDSMQHESGVGDSISLNDTSSIHISSTANRSEILESSEKEATITSDEDMSTTNVTAQSSMLDCTQTLNSTEKSVLECSTETENSINASAINSQTNSMESSGLEYSNALNIMDKSGITNNSIVNHPENDTGLGESINKQNETNDCSNTKNKEDDLLAESTDVVDNLSATINEIECEQNETGIELTAEKKTENDKNEVNLDKIRVYLPHLDDEGVYFSDLDDQEHRMLSPRVITTDVFPSIPGKENITIVVDDDIRTLLNIEDDEPPPTYTIPVQIRPSTPPLELNIFKFHKKILKRRLLFKLGPDILLKSSSTKRYQCGDASDQRQYRPMKLFNDATHELCATETDYNVLSDCEDGEEFLGFTEEEQANKILHRLSRDSGVDADVALAPNVCNLDVISEDLNEATQLQKPIATNEEIVDFNKATQLQEPIARNEEIVDFNEATQLQEPIATNEEIVEGVDKGENDLPPKNTEALLHSKENDCTIEDATIEDSALEESTYPSEVPNDVDTEINNTIMDPTLFIENELRNSGSEQDVQNCKTKIQKWHEYLQPILAKARDRHHFDVFQLGTEIMNELQKPIISRSHISASSITFQDVMINKDDSYVSRYFLSTLLLANQNNLKIDVSGKCTEEPSSWSDINLELLDTKRHTVAIEDNIGMVQPKLISKSSTTKQNLNKLSATPELRCNSRLNISDEVVHVNLNVLRPLKQIEKLPSTNDDYDSGIFSNEECSS